MFENTDFYTVIPQQRVYATIKMAINEELKKQECSSISFDLQQENEESEILE
jgi:hypothetical protein